MTAATLISLLRQEFGLSEILVSDNYPAFESKEFQQFLKRNWMKLKRSTVLS